MTKEEKKLMNQVLVLLECLKKETKKQILKDEAERLINKLKNRL